MILLLLLMNLAHAFGRSEGVENYRDPSSTLADYFTSARRDDRPDPSYNSWPTDTEIQSRSSRFLETIRGDSFHTCPYSESCKTADISRWLDWDIWFQINREAALIWSRLVDCQNGNSEKARQAYYRARDLCPGDKEEGRALFDRISQLHGKVADFAGSTRIQRIDPWMDRERLTLLPPVAPTHPLYAQILVEHATTIVRFSTADGGFPRGITHPQYWIEPRYNRSFGTRAQSVVRGLPESQKPEYNQARAYVNTLTLLSLLPQRTPQDVDRWGLWADASSLVIRHIHNQMQISHAANDDHRSAAFLASDVLGRDWRDQQVSHPPALVEADASVIVEMRSLAARYGLATDRRQYCVSQSLQYRFCFALDPSNPAETFDAF